MSTALSLPPGGAAGRAGVDFGLDARFLGAGRREERLGARAAPLAQHQRGDGQHVVHRDLGPLVHGGVGARRLEQHDLGAVQLDVQAR